MSASGGVRKPVKHGCPGAFRTRRELVQAARDKRRILLAAHQITTRLSRFKSKVTTSIASHTASGEKSTGSVRSLGK